MAAVALDAQEPVFQQAALQVILELLADEPRQVTARVLDLPQEAWVVLSDYGVEGGLFRPVAVVGGSGGNWGRSKHQA